MDQPARRRRVLFLNSTNFYNRATHKGAAEYAIKQNWSFNYLTAKVDDDLIDHIKALDGMIAHGLSVEQLDRVREHTNLPIVTTGHYFDEVPKRWVKPVLFDENKIGRMACRYLINKGHRRLVFVGRGRNPNYARYKSLRLEAEEFSNVEVSISAINDLTKEFLLSLPRPFAIALTNDTIAPEVMFRLEDNGLRIPLDAAVLGFDNDLLYCETTPVPLSSVDINSNLRGVIAAQALGQMMDDPKTSTDAILVEPNRIVERASTDLYAVSHPATARALQYIRDNLGNPSIKVGDIVRSAQVSRRSLESAFSEHLNQTIANVILHLRTEWAIELIQSNQLSMTTIAKTCGFSSPQSMSRSFKRKLGRPPSFYKPQAQPTHD